MIVKLELDLFFENNLVAAKLLRKFNYLKLIFAGLQSVFYLLKFTCQV
jgi:hypothetical protein